MMNQLILFKYTKTNNESAFYYQYNIFVVELVRRLYFIYYYVCVRLMVITRLNG